MYCDQRAGDRSMNSSILKKILAELQSPSPRLDYCVGMLETLIEMGHSSVEEQSPYKAPAAGSIPAVPKPKDEGDALNASAAAKLAGVKKMAAESLTL